MRLEDAFGAVKSAGHDGEGAGRDRVGLKRRGCERDELRIGRLEPADTQLLAEPHPCKGRLEVRQQFRVGQPDRQISDMRGKRRLRDVAARGRRCPQSRSRRHAGPATALGDHEAALTQDPVRRVHGRGARAELLGQRADRRERVAGGDPAVSDRRFGIRRDLPCGRPRNPILF